MTFFTRIHQPRLFHYEGKRCVYCGEVMTRTRGYNHYSAPSRDHRVPTWRGGYNERDNVVICCRGCNELKGSLDSEEFYAVRQGLASRLDHGWWQKKRSELFHPPLGAVQRPQLQEEELVGVSG